MRLMVLCIQPNDWRYRRSLDQDACEESFALFDGHLFATASSKRSSARQKFPDDPSAYTFVIRSLVTKSDIEHMLLLDTCDEGQEGV